jgi:hypothetical protein
MKKLTLVLGICLLAGTSMKAQLTQDAPVSNKPNNMAIGYHVNDFNHDFGFGLGVTSPYFAYKIFAVRLSYNFQRFNFIDTTHTYTSVGYKNIKIGLSTNAIILDKIRLYGEIGMAALVCPVAITSKNTSYGGYGLFGFEFLISKGFSYYIELGAIGTKTKADNVPTVPIFSNGFTTTAGLRVYLGKG